jgi:hypothetical protein
MMVVGENEYTEESIKESLETLYAASGYLNADCGNMEFAMHLIGAAIVELEIITERNARPHIRMVYSATESGAAD